MCLDQEVDTPCEGRDQLSRGIQHHWDDVRADVQEVLDDSGGISSRVRVRVRREVRVMVRVRRILSVRSGDRTRVRIRKLELFDNEAARLAGKRDTGRGCDHG